MLFLIAYDICHPRRLRRVARALERRAVRCQYSVFRFRGTVAELATLLDELAKLIRPSEDVIQAWPIPPNTPADAFAIGAVRPVQSASVVIAGRHPLFVRGADTADTPPSEEPS